MWVLQVALNSVVLQVAQIAQVPLVKPLHSITQEIVAALDSTGDGAILLLPMLC